MSKKSFTLIELLVVISIIAILAGMLLPSLGKTKQTAQTTLCLNNHKQLGMAMEAYHNAYDDYYPFQGMFNLNWVFGFADIKSDNWPTYNAKSLKLIDYHVFFCPASKTSFEDGMAEFNQPSPRWHSDYGYNWYILSREKKPNSGHVQEKRPHCAQPASQYVIMDSRASMSDEKGVTLVNSYQSTTERFPDAFRHDGKTNILYADGHMETVKIADRYRPHGTLGTGDAWKRLNPSYSWNRFYNCSR